MSLTVENLKRESEKRDAKIYRKLSVQVNKQISTLKQQKADAGRKAKDGKLSEANRLVWKGMETAYSNALSELELANERAHYNF